MTHIINTSLNTGIVPSQMKTAKVIPIFKASDPCLLKNYRPVSLLSAFSKILEKIMFDKVTSFLCSNDILYKHQYGFRSKHSTIHPILHLLNHCAEANNKPKSEYTLAVFCDLSKAFDVIDHKILLHKLRAYGLRGIVNTWFENYLTGRTQFVEIENQRSTLKHLLCGVPQGSILGPLLYLIYVNDICKACDHKILSFADDTTIYMSNSDLDLLYEYANNGVHDLFNWFCANKLSLNANKTKYIVIRPHQMQSNFEDKFLWINNVPLERIGNNCRESSTKFLGIHIDEFLTWKKHIAQVNSKISRAIFAIKQLKFTMPVEILKTLYFALIHPHIAYGILAWGNARSSVIRKTITLQKYAIRSINRAPHNSHTDPLFKATEILKISDFYTYQATLFMFDFVNKRLPRSFDGVFLYNRDIYQHYTTRQSHLMHIPRCHKYFASQLPLNTIPNIWNKWANSLPIGLSRGQIKTYIKSALLLFYPTQVRCSNNYCRNCN